MRSKHIEFDNRIGEKLSGQLDFPLVGQPKAYAIFAHCFTCAKNLKVVETISRSLTNQQIAVLRFDFTGLGKSDGNFADTNFSSNLSDLQSAYDYLDQTYVAPQLLIGHSLGGSAVLHVSSQLEAVKAVVTIGAPADPQHVMKLIAGGEEVIREKGIAEVNIGGRPFKIKKQFIDDLDRRKPKQLFEDFDKALLILHSPQDQIVSINNAATIYQMARHPKSFISLDGADHLLGREADAQYAGSIIGSWASRYLTDTNEPQITPEGEVWARLGESGFLTEITAGNHNMLADEPKESGGTDLGPSPYGFLLSALGACTAMTLRMYADHKKWNLKEVNVKLTHDKVHVQDGQEKGSGKIDEIKRSIKLEGNLTTEQRERLMEIADRCPVHKTLEGKPHVITELLNV